MDANTPELIHFGPATTTATLSTTVFNTFIPLIENLSIVEIGFFNNAGADAAIGALALCAMDSTAGALTLVDLGVVCTRVAGSIQGTTTRRLTDVFVERNAATPNTVVLSNRALTPATGVGGPVIVLPSASKQFVAVGLRVSATFTTNSVITAYIKYRKCGAGSTAEAGDVIVTA